MRSKRKSHELRVSVSNNKTCKGNVPRELVFKDKVCEHELPENGESLTENRISYKHRCFLLGLLIFLFSLSSVTSASGQQNSSESKSKSNKTESSGSNGTTDSTKNNRLSSQVGDTRNNTDEKLKKTIRENFQQLQQLASNGKWKELRSKMAKKAADDFCVNQVISAHRLIVLHKIYKDEFRRFQDPAQKLKDLFLKYEFDRKPIRNFSTMTEMMDPSGFEKAKKCRNKILKTLKTKGKAWEFVDKLYSVQSVPGLSIYSIHRKIKKIVIQKPTTALVFVSRERKDLDGELYATLYPTVFRFEKDPKAGWLFHGVDYKETQKVRQKFVQSEKEIFDKERREDKKLVLFL